MNLTLDSLKQLAQDPKFIQLAADCLAWQTLAETTRERVDRYVRIVFNAFEFRVSPRMGEHFGNTGERITDPKLLYLCEDEATLKDYYAWCDRAHRKAGYDLSPGHCPALVAEHEQNKTEHAFLAYTDSVLGTPFADTYLENRDKALRLIFGIALKNPQTERLAHDQLPRTHADACARISAANIDRTRTAPPVPAPA